MKQHFQMCSYKGHEGTKVKYVCLEMNCQLKRLYCVKCLRDNHHNHGQGNNKNLLDHQELQDFIKGRIEYLKKQDLDQENEPYIQECIKTIGVIKLQIETIQNILQELQTKSYIKIYIQSLQNKLETVSNSKLSIVDDQFLSDLIYIDSNQERQLMKCSIKQQCDYLLKNCLIIQQLSEKEIEIEKLNNSQDIPQQQQNQEDIQCNDLKTLVSSQDNTILKIQMCSIQGHEKNKVKFVCLDAECQQNKLLCSQCFIDKNHKHGYDGKILDKIGLEFYIQQQIDQILHQSQKPDHIFIQRFIGNMKNIQLQMNSILENLKKLQTQSQTENKISFLGNQLQIIQQTKLSSFDEKFIRQLININIDFPENQRYILQEIRCKCDLVMENIVNLKQVSEQQRQKQSLRCIEFERTQFGQSSYQDIFAATISNDMRYIVTSNIDKYLKIWKYQDYTLIKEHIVKEIVIIKFTDDSSLLYIGTGQGLLYCYDVKLNFQETYKQIIHNDGILNLYSITNHIILTSSHDQYIRKTNTQPNQQIISIKAHKDSIDGLDYHRAKDIIASCSNDNFIKLWDNKNGQLLIQKQNAYQSILSQVLFINNRDFLISLDSKSQINNWHIKYDSKELLLINTIKDSNIIFNISLVLDQQFILLICKEDMKFYTIQGELVHQIKHDVKYDVKEFFMIRQVQLDSIRSIIIQGKFTDIQNENMILLKQNNRQLLNILHYDSSLIFLIPKKISFEHNRGHIFNLLSFQITILPCQSDIQIRAKCIDIQQRAFSLKKYFVQLFLLFQFQRNNFLFYNINFYYQKGEIQKMVSDPEQIDKSWQGKIVIEKILLTYMVQIIVIKEQKLDFVNYKNSKLIQR